MGFSLLNPYTQKNIFKSARMKKTKTIKTGTEKKQVKVDSCKEKKTSSTMRFWTSKALF